MRDYEMHLSGDQGYNGKTLEERLSGKFYTPTQLGDDLAKQMVAAFDPNALKRVNATDPFCGDGRLLTALLSAAAMRPELVQLPWRIELRDQDASAVQCAAERVRSCASNVGIRAEIFTFVGNTFESELKPRFDFVITNPPWELLKPDKRELEHLSSIGTQRYKDDLRTASRQLDERFPDACSKRAWGGWGTNLARCGWDLGLRTTQKGGILGIVLPATIMGDQSSTSIRKKAFSKNQLLDAAVYPSEARLFDRVDQPVAALTFQVGRNASRTGIIRSFDAQRLLTGQHSLDFNEVAMEARDWRLPIGRPAAVEELFPKFTDLPILRTWEGQGASDLWLGRELDETRVADKLTAGQQNPFIKGRMIARHAVVEEPVRSVLPSLCKNFHSTGKPRAVWRDVARATSKRRMVGTVIPPKWVAGNSLHVACYQDGDFTRTVALHALLTSYVTEAQIRSWVTTGHMSLGAVRRAHLPVLDGRTVNLLSSLACDVMKGGKDDAELRLEIAVAKAYGLNRDEMAQLLTDFPKLEDSKREDMINSAVWSE